MQIEKFVFFLFYDILYLIIEQDVYMMIKRLDRRSRILIEVIIFSLFIAIVSTSYAYFIISVNGEGMDNDVYTGKMQLSFVDGNSISAFDITPGQTIEKEFSVINTGSVDSTYDVYFSEVINTFSDKEDLVYTLTSSNGCEKNDETVVASNSGEKLVDKCFIAPGDTHKYNLHILFKETNNSQDDNRGRIFTSKINVDEFKYYGSNLPGSSSGITPTKKVLNVDELKTTNATLSDIVETKGYYTDGDGGAAYYTIEEKTDQSVDDGLYIELNNGKVAHLVSINNSYNLRQFGAKGNGVDDDNAQLRKAIIASKNKTLFVPSGTYMTSSTIRMWRYSNITIIGEGHTSVIKAMDNFEDDSSIFYYEYVNNLTISNITFDGNIEENTIEEGYDARSGISLLDLWNGNNITIDNCYFQNNGYGGIRLVKDSNDLYVTNSHFTNIDCGIIHIGSTGSGDNWWIEKNIFDGHSYSEPVSVGGGVRFTNIHIIDNVMKNKENANAINLIANSTDVSYENVEIIGNEIDNMATGINVKNSHNVVIRNNRVTNMVSGQGISLGNSTDALVYDNYVENVDQRGIFINGCSDTKFYDNTVIDAGKTNNDYFFVDIRGENNNVEFYNNTIERKDESLYEFSIVMHGDGGVRMYDNNVINSKILLYTDASNMYVANNGCVVSDRGTNNTVIQ